MASVKIPTSFNIDLEFETANFGMRLAAWLIDGLIRGVYVFIISFFLSGMFSGGSMPEPIVYILYFFVYVLPLACYFLVLEILMNGQTPGKLILGIKVRNMNGGKPSISQHLIRWLFRIIETPYIIVNGIIPVISMVRSPYDQRLGDVVAGTIVVNIRSKTSLNETIFRDMSAIDYTPQFPQILKLSDRDMNKIKELMDRAVRSQDAELTARVSSRVRDVLDIQTEMDHLPFLETVLNDYNYYTTR